MFSRLIPAITAGAFVAGGFMLLTGMKSCGSTDPSGDDTDVVCQTAKDCEGLPHIECVGAWSCDGGQCSFECGVVDPGIVLLPNPGACTSDAQCGKGQVCSDDYGCYSSQCTADGTICTKDCVGLCVDAPALQPCTQDLDCGVGRWCDYTECVGNACEGVCRGDDPIDPNTGCTGDDQCGSGEYCQISCAPCMAIDPAIPDAPMPNCPCFGQCLPKNPDVGCTSDDQCGSGEYCQVSCAPCMAIDPAIPDAPMPSCPCYGQCLPKVEPQQCQTDADCGAGYACVCGADPSCPMCDVCFFQCQPVTPPPPVCGENGLCPDGTKCDCLPDPNCPECAACYLTCVPVDPPAGCTSDSQCAPGQICEIQACPPCWFGAECPPCTGVCTDNPAPPAYDCSVDSDCKDGLVCQLAVCAGCACPAGSDCDCAEPSCWGYCQKPVPPPVACAADSDCAAGQVCELYCSKAPCTPDWCPPCTGTCVDAAPPPTECVVSGCSGEICADQEMASICIYDPWYECLQYTKCGNFAADGTCGWLPTQEFQACLEKLGAPIPY